MRRVCSKACPRSLAPTTFLQEPGHHQPITVNLLIMCETHGWMYLCLTLLGVCVLQELVCGQEVCGLALQLAREGLLAPETQDRQGSTLVNHLHPRPHCHHHHLNLYMYSCT